MNNILALSAVLGLVLMIIGCTGPAPAVEDVVVTSGPFGQVQAVFNGNCTMCHGGDRPMGLLDLSNYEAVMRGGEAGAIVVPKDSGSSIVVQSLRGIKGRKPMPANSPALPEAEIKLIEDWISAGAQPDEQ